ncbi:hypothetical protein SCARR_04839 [Pontiella sulfatireligans]|uniref:Uncharacterized protein n=1 Tax=Pontiella sulfatireligans TaxID=2750658 RepID=A0A6C2US15_9BACT|nr:hypothetical protein SCARR_04839 [Pontiella sulfatireligans]
MVINMIGMFLAVARLFRLNPNKALTRRFERVVFALCGSEC